MFGQASDVGDLRHRPQRRRSHPVEAVLDAVAMGRGEDVEHGGEDQAIVGAVVRRLVRPAPAGQHGGGAHAVAGGLNGRVGVHVVVGPAGGRGLHEGEAAEAGGDGGALPRGRNLRIGVAVIVEHEGMGVRRAAHRHARPFGLGGRDGGGLHLRIAVEEALGHGGDELLRVEREVLAGDGWALETWRAPGRLG